MNGKQVCPSFRLMNDSDKLRLVLQEISREKWEHDAPYKSDLTNEKDVTGTNANERKPDAQSLVSPSNVTKTGAPPGFF